MAFEIYFENHFANNTYFEKIKGKGFLEKKLIERLYGFLKKESLNFIFNESHDFYDKISRKVVLFWKSYLFIWVRNELKRGFLFLKSFMGFYLWKGEGLKRKSNCFFFFFFKVNGNLYWKHFYKEDFFFNKREFKRE